MLLDQVKTFPLDNESSFYYTEYVCAMCFINPSMYNYTALQPVFESQKKVCEG
jgi:hypothetical protein